ncbi:hypothetical protein [Nonomuraea sp. GTA35]|uniref:hypothetical protein n=1 Tax=Nonomuraea sp. GTA35 TaxID=1676746 RepID=UPI0035C1CEC8
MTAADERWIWVSLPQATFAVVTKNGRVVDAAPIAQWLIGKDEREVAKYLRGKGAVFVPLDPFVPPRTPGDETEDRTRRAG